MVNIVETTVEEKEFAEARDFVGRGEMLESSVRDLGGHAVNFVSLHGNPLLHLDGHCMICMPHPRD